MQQQRRMTYQADTASRTRRIALFLCMLLSARCISFGGGGRFQGHAPGWRWGGRSIPQGRGKVEQNPTLRGHEVPIHLKTCRSSTACFSMCVGPCISTMHHYHRPGMAVADMQHEIPCTQ
jgi:hypothetical protein